MNCRPGDLAIVTTGPNSGKIVVCLEYLGLFITQYPNSERVSHWWKIDRPLVSCVDEFDFECECQDEILKPLRDNPGEDETLTWAGKPNEVKQPA